MSKVTKLENRMKTPGTKKKVAAYARVSKDSDDSFHSISAQISYYNSLIQKDPTWEYAGVYADEGISGTGKAKRSEFSRLVRDCEAGKIDIVLTKSISRFARNTVDLLETVRHLKDLGVEVRFERENISTMSGDGELMLTILASFAQAEAETTSQNVKWMIKKKHEKGIPHTYHPVMGYRWSKEKKQLIVVPEEAELVKRIFMMYRDGNSLQEIEKKLNEEGVKPMRADRFHITTISRMLDNVTYTGDLLLQKYYVTNPVNGKLKKNKGELPQYYAENTHEAIIDRELFDAVQRRKERMREVLGSEHYEVRAFSRKIICGRCGRKYVRVHSNGNGHSYYYWKCWMKKDGGVKACPSFSLREDKLERLFCELLGLQSFDKEVFREEVDRIIAFDDLLEIHFADGEIKEVQLG